MTFNVFIKSKVLDDLPIDRRDQIIEALKDLKNNFRAGISVKLKVVKRTFIELELGITEHFIQLILNKI